MRLGYKIVMEGMRGLLYSPFAPESSALTYTVGQWIEPQPGCGPLFCYATSDQAAKFADLMSRYIGVNRQKLSMYVCEYEPWREKLRRARTLCYNLEPVFGWTRDGDYLHLSDLLSPMVRDVMWGLRLCSRIRLIREIQTGE